MSKQVKFIKGHTRYSYFAGDVVDISDLGADAAKKLIDTGFAIPVTKDDTIETPEGRLSADALEVRTGAEASPSIDAGLPATESAPIANVPDAERLGIDDKRIVSPEIDRNISEGKPAKK